MSIYYAKTYLDIDLCAYRTLRRLLLISSPSDLITMSPTVLGQHGLFSTAPNRNGFRIVNWCIIKTYYFAFEIEQTVFANDKSN